MCVCTICRFEVMEHMSVPNMSIVRVHRLIPFCLCGFYKTKNPAVSSSTLPSNKQPQSVCKNSAFILITYKLIHSITKLCPKVTICRNTKERLYHQGEQSKRFLAYKIRCMSTQTYFLVLAGIVPCTSIKKKHGIRSTGSNKMQRIRKNKLLESEYR